MKKITASPKVYVSDSEIAKKERGVLAAQNIKKGEIVEICPLIIVSGNDMSNLAESILVTYFFYFGKDRLVVALGFGSLYNHSHKPNAIYKINERQQIMTFRALRDIKKDEEITFNYSRGNPSSKAPLWFEVS